MTNNIENKSIPESDYYVSHDIDLVRLFSILWSEKLLITISSSLFLILSIIFSLSITNTYTSTSLLAPANNDDSLSSQLSNFSSIGAFAGLTLPSNKASKSIEAIERIQSYNFFSKNFLPKIKLENIMAVSRWNSKENKLVYDDSLFDSNNNKWVRNVKYPKSIIPSSQEAYKVYLEAVAIIEDKKTSFVKISVDHKSPYISKKWLEIIIYEVNESMRNFDYVAAKENISYLNEISETTNIKTIKEVISKLLENEMQILMLTSSTDDYVFKSIDSPIAPEEKSKPNRFLIIFVGAILGFIISIFFALGRAYIFKNV